MEWKIPLTDLDYGAAEEAAVLEVLRSKWLTMGSRTRAFEVAMAGATGAEFAVMVSSATAGLYSLLAALEIGPGDEVLLPSMTFMATANVIVQRGATPVFCDIISPELPLIDPEEVRRNLSPATRAVFTVDYAGYPCDYDAIFTVLADYSEECQAARGETGKGVIHLLEDAAHGVGGALDEQRVLGNCADAGVYSFFSNKNLPIGEGGMVLTNRPDIAEGIRLMRQHGMTVNTWERHQGGVLDYNVARPGWNFRPGEIQAALGLAQLGRLAANQEARLRLTRRYQAALAGIPGVTVPFAHIKTWHAPACHLMPVLLPDAATRDNVRMHMNSVGIQTSHHYPPVHLFEYYSGRNAGLPLILPKTEEYSEREVTLPLYPAMTDDDADRVAAELRRAIGA